MHLERLLKQQRQLDRGSQRILEINPRHALVQALAAQVGRDGAGAVVEDAAWLLLDQARIIEGEPLPDASAFSRRLSTLVERRSEEHTSELQSLMRISYAVFCLKKKTKNTKTPYI